MAANQATTDLGGGLFIVGGSTRIERSVIEENSSLAGGGGAHINPNYGAEAVIVDTTIRRNRTTAQNPPSSLAGIAGGGIYLAPRCCWNVCTIAENEAGEAAGLFNYAGTSHLTVRDTAIMAIMPPLLAGAYGAAARMAALPQRDDQRQPR